MKKSSSEMHQYELADPVDYPWSTCLSCLICVYKMNEITVYFVSENTSIGKSENEDFFAGVYESGHFSWILLMFYLLALIGSAGMILAQL